MSSKKLLLSTGTSHELNEVTNLKSSPTSCQLGTSSALELEFVSFTNKNASTGLYDRIIRKQRSTEIKLITVKLNNKTNQLVLFVKTV